MRTSEDRVDELHRRMRARKHAMLRRRYLRISALSACACLAVLVLIANVISRISVRVLGTMNAGATASIFADHAALGYVVVSILAFCLGSLVSVLCYRLRRRMQEEEGQDG